MTEAELVNTVYLVNDALNSNFEFWLTASFAVLVAFFFAGDKIFGYVKWTLLLLYIFGTVSLSLKMVVSLLRGLVVVTELQEMNSTMIIGTGALGVSAHVLQALVLILGTVATTYFVLNSDKYSKRDQRIDT